MKLSTDPYKGVRDFYPEDMAVQRQIFDIWSSVVERYGYQRYDASVLEPSELYRAKSSEEIVNDQTYNFTDRGDREVTLRPEMTPTVARMVAHKKKELIYPLRWYSIPNLFRYEQPQKGRLREHWQLNVDIFGVDTLEADVEVIQIAHDIVIAYGLSLSDFEIRLNNRRLVEYVTKDIFSLDDTQAKKISRLVDKKDKIPGDVFTATVENILGSGVESKKSKEFLTLINSQNFEEFTIRLPQTKDEHKGLKEIKEVLSALEKLGITNVRFDQSLMRGFDYYTGTIFEIFDKNPENRRSVFGGGRYDDLLSLFGSEKVSAVGFGAGDVIAKDLLKTYGKIISPEDSSPADVCICLLDKSSVTYAQEVAQSLRQKNIRVSIDYSFRKIGDQIANADKLHIPNIICIGEEEVQTGQLKLKNLKSGKENVYTVETLKI